MKRNSAPTRIRVTRLGVILEPEGYLEAEGILNPAGCLDREGNLLLFPRLVERGNRSRVGIVSVQRNADDSLVCTRMGFALSPVTADELGGNGGEGCEDPRVTYVPCLNAYLMAYTAYSSVGPRIAVAVSKNAYHWTRVGVVQFPQSLKLHADDKDAAFFPEPVKSPSGVISIAMYHRPMVHTPMVVGKDEIQSVLANAASARQSIRIAYTPLAALGNILDPEWSANAESLAPLTRPTESNLVMAPSRQWGSVKIGGGSAPVRIKEGWLSVYHGVDAVPWTGGGYQMRYSAGIVVHDALEPHRILYR